jgi:hypothetical protein
MHNCTYRKFCHVTVHYLNYILLFSKGLNFLEALLKKSSKCSVVKQNADPFICILEQYDSAFRENCNLFSKP